MTESFAELLEESLATQQIKQGAILTGTVIEVNSDVVIVNAGLKSEAVIPANQFLDEHGELEVNVGDEVEVALDAVEDGFGETRLSREKAKRALTCNRLEDAFEQGKVVSGMDVVRAIHEAPVREGTQVVMPPVEIVRAARKGTSGTKGAMGTKGP